MRDDKFVIAICEDCVPTFPMPFENNDDGHKKLVEWSREHTDGTGHTVLIPFRIYERKGR